ncbi:MAG: hypothetical protein NC911_01790 [Candidatus Omnitrophica bacterium]|nr:hypothetical protein [Candidatus Omnitrophota bacterium]
MSECYPLTPASQLCFFGYYDKCPWDERGQYFLFHRVEFQDRPPTADDRAEICVLELNSGKIEVVGKSFAWNFQQGAMLQWLPGRRILYNDREKGKFIARVKDFPTGKEKILPRPVSAVSLDGRKAASLNFSRLAVWRPGYGYEGIPDPVWEHPWPEDDGLWMIDIETGKDELIVPLAKMLEYRLEENIRNMVGRFNHTLFAPDGQRLIFLCRWKASPVASSVGFTRLFTVNPDGTELCDLLDTYYISHFCWKNAREILVYASLEGKQAFWVVEDKTRHYRLVSERLQKTDGHCSYNQAETLILNDTYPINGYRELNIFDTRQEKTTVLGRYYSLPLAKGEIRCDLHPRWSNDYRKISFDSTHEGYRRVYGMDLEDKITG